LCREVYEEVGIEVKPNELEHILTIHHSKTDYKAQKLDVIEFYFLPKRWEGSPTIKEPDKASELGLFPLNDLPSPLPQGLLLALDAMKNGIRFIEN
jgi:8-oxo-dGTP diphosphatase